MQEKIYKYYCNIFENRLIINLIIIYLLLFSLILFIIRFKFAFFPVPVSGGAEVNPIYGIQKILQDGQLYMDPEKPPYAITQYSPLYFYASSFVALLLNVKADDIAGLVVIGRVLNLLFAVLTIIVSYLIGKNVFKINYSISILACAFIFCFFNNTCFTVRPDAAKVFFVTTSLFFALKYLETNKLVYVRLLSVGAVLAVSSKQDGIIVIPIILSFLFIYKDYKGILVGLITFTVFGGILFLFLYNLFGYTLSKNIVGGINNGISYKEYISVQAKYLPANIGWIAFVFFICFEFILNALYTKTEKFLAYTVCILFLFANLTSLKVGSGTVYYTDFQNMSFILIACFIGKKFHRPNLTQLKPFIYLYITVFLFLPSISAIIRFTSFSETYSLAKEEFIAQSQIKNYFAKNIHFAKNEFIFSNLSNNGAGESNRGDYISNLLYDQVIAPQKDVIQVVYRLGVFNYGSLAEDFKSGKVKYIITSKDNKPTRFLFIDFVNYSLLQNIGNYSIYKKIDEK